MSPRISVLIPVYNTKTEYLKGAIESILNQSYKDFELIILDDGSESYVKDIVKSYKDERIKYIYKPNTGIADTLNVGLEMARGEYIARMDADDLALPHRFKKQVEFLDNNPSISVVGAAVMKFQEDFGIVRFPLQPTYKHFLYCCAISHPALMFRRDDFRKHNLWYDPKYSCEDYELWSRAVRVLNFYNLPEVLLYYRINDTSITQTKQEILEKDSNKVQANLRKYLKEHGLPIPPKPDEVDSDYKYRYNFHLFGKHLKLTRLKRNIAIVNLKGKGGSLGDQMFQYAYGKALELKYGYDVRYDDSFYHWQFTGIAPECYPYALHIFPKLKMKFAGGDCVQRIKRDYLIKLRNVFVKHEHNRGYYKAVVTDDKDFKEYSSVFRELFTFPKLTDSTAKGIYQRIVADPNSVFIDASDFHQHPLRYREAIAKFKENLSHPTFFVFNDKYHEFTSSDDTYLVDRDQHFDEATTMQLMSSCKNGIRADNSLSWWSGWLIRDVNKVVL